MMAHSPGRILSICGNPEMLPLLLPLCFACSGLEGECSPGTRPSVNLTAVANVRDSDGPVGVVNLVENAVIAEANPPALAFRQLLASCRPGILAKGVDLVLCNAELLRRQIGKFFLGSRQDEKVVAHFRERFISALA